MDPIADFLTHIRNASAAGKTSVTVPYSSVKFDIATLLEKEGYVSSVVKKGRKIKKYLEVGIVHNGKKPRISGVVRMSKPSRRIYCGAKEIKSVRHGYGMLVLSTPKGVIGDKEAKKEHVGGEMLFKIW